MQLDDDLAAALADAENRVVVAFGSATTWGNRVRRPAFPFGQIAPGPPEVGRLEYVRVARADLPGIEARSAVTIDEEPRQVVRLYDGPDTDAHLVILELTDALSS